MRTIIDVYWQCPEDEEYTWKGKFAVLCDDGHKEEHIRMFDDFGRFSPGFRELCLRTMLSEDDVPCTPLRDLVCRNLYTEEEWREVRDKFLWARKNRQHLSP